MKCRNTFCMLMLATILPLLLIAFSVITAHAACRIEPVALHPEEGKIGDRVVPPCDWELWETPSWLNFCLGKDHIARRMDILPPEIKDS